MRIIIIMLKCMDKKHTAYFVLGIILLCLIIHNLFSKLRQTDYTNRHKNACLTRNSSKTFPRHIHQLWKNLTIPPTLQDYQKGCLDKNPGYNYTLWTDESIIKFLEENYPWFMGIYHNYPYNIQRVDAVRYFILFHYGGAYIDMDFICHTTFDDIYASVPQDTDTVLGATYPFSVTNSMMISKRGHPFMRHVMYWLPRAKGSYGFPYWTILFSTGPSFLYRAYLDYPCPEKVHILEHRLWTEVFFEHTHASTWHEWDGPFWVSLYEYGKTCIFICVCLIILVIYKCTRKNCDYYSGL